MANSWSTCGRATWTGSRRGPGSATRSCSCTLRRRGGGAGGAHARGSGAARLRGAVADVWPEFAQAGKEDLPLRYLLTHQAGLSVIDEELPVGAELEWDVMAGALARQAPVWTPGEKQGYHAASFRVARGRGDPASGRALGGHVHPRGDRGAAERGLPPGVRARGGPPGLRPLPRAGLSGGGLEPGGRHAAGSHLARGAHVQPGAAGAQQGAKQPRLPRLRAAGFERPRKRAGARDDLRGAGIGGRLAGAPAAERGGDPARGDAADRGPGHHSADACAAAPWGS